MWLFCSRYADVWRAACTPTAYGRDFHAGLGPRRSIRERHHQRHHHDGVPVTSSLTKRTWRFRASGCTAMPVADHLVAGLPCCAARDSYRASRPRVEHSHAGRPVSPHVPQGFLITQVRAAVLRQRVHVQFAATIFSSGPGCTCCTLTLGVIYLGVGLALGAAGLSHPAGPLALAWLGNAGYSPFANAHIFC